MQICRYFSRGHLLVICPPTVDIRIFRRYNLSPRPSRDSYLFAAHCISNMHKSVNIAKKSPVFFIFLAIYHIKPQFLLPFTPPKSHPFFVTLMQSFTYSLSLFFSHAPIPILLPNEKRALHRSALSISLFLPFLAH